MFQLLFENARGLPPGIFYFLIFLKYKQLLHIISRFQVGAAFLIERQINPVLILYTFSVRDILFRDKESVALLSNNKQKYLGIRQQGRVFAGFIS